MIPSPGEVLLHYRLIEKIGAGGMGEIWKGLDTSLDRTVAIKILPPALAADADRLARFEREAKLLASLHHPNIATVHGLHKAGGIHFLAMELATGEDLAQRLAQAPLAFEESVKIAMQAAAGLEAAHEAGVVHRDFKPANVMVSADNEVKILDFGLAKGVDAATASGNPLVSSLVTSAGTQAGVLLGTAAYMSPEQARGAAVDKRADIWAYGCVLFEMLARRRAFPGATIPETLAAVLKSEPDWSALPALTPPALRRLVERCLVKDPALRMRDMGEARIVLHQQSMGATASTGAAATPTTSHARRRIAAAVALAAGGLAVGLGLGRALWPRAEPLGQGLGATAHVRPLTFEPGLQHEPALSPDGNYVAYVTDARGNLDIVVQPLAGGVPNWIVTHAADDAQPAWSPDGSRLAFVSARAHKGRLSATSGLGLLSQFVYGIGCDIFLTTPTGGTAIALVDNGSHPTWSPNGDEVAFESLREGHWDLWAVSVRGGSLRRLTSDEAIDYEPSWSPDGRWIAYASSTGEFSLVVVPAQGGERIVLLHGDALVQSPSWSADGRYLYFASDRAGTAGILNLWRLAFSPSSPSAHPVPERVTVGEGSDVGPRPAGAGRLTFSTVQFAPDIWELDIASGTTRAITATPCSEDFPHVSRDGILAMVSDRGGGAPSLWTMRLDGSDLTRTTAAPDEANWPRWSPDGRRLAYGVRRGNVYTIVIRDPQGVSEVEVARVNGPATVFLAEWSPDGRHLAYCTTAGIETAIWVKPLEGEARQITATGTSSQFPTWSPDGSRLAFHRQDDKLRQIWTVPVAGGEPTRLTHDDSTEFSHPQWCAAHPDEILVVLDHKNLGLVSARTGDFRALTSFDSSTLLVDYPSWSSDGTKVYFSLARKTGHVFLLEGI